MGGGGSRGGGTSTTTNEIPAELKPLFAQTGQTLQELQPQISGQFPEFFGANPQQIPGVTPGQMDIIAAQRARAFGMPYSGPELAALGQAQQFMDVPFGQLPSTVAGFEAI